MNEEVLGNEVSPQATESPSLPTAEFQYAGFWRRFGAYWLDAIIFLPLGGLLILAGEKTRFANLYFFLPSMVVSLWLHVYLVQKYGGTPGKLLLKIRIARLDGSSVGYREAMLRFSVLFILSSLTSLAIVLASLQLSNAEYFELGFVARNLKFKEIAPFWYQPVQIAVNIWIWSEFISMLMNKQRRAFHDFMAGTIVIRK